jgi:hypothetical protein
LESKDNQKLVCQRSWDGKEKEIEVLTVLILASKGCLYSSTKLGLQET